MASAELNPAVRRTLFCYAHERLTRTLRNLADLQEAAYAEAVKRGYYLGPLFVEEDNSGRAMQALIDAMTDEVGHGAIAVPHRGHLIPLGGPQEWQQVLEELTGHPLVFISHSP